MFDVRSVLAALLLAACTASAATVQLRCRPALLSDPQLDSTSGVLRYRTTPAVVVTVTGSDLDDAHAHRLTIKSKANPTATPYVAHTAWTIAEATDTATGTLDLNVTALGTDLGTADYILCEVEFRDDTGDDVLGRGTLKVWNSTSREGDVAPATTSTHDYTDSQIDTLIAGLQASDADLTAISALTGTGLLDRTGSGTYTTRTATTAGLAILDDADAGAQRTTLGLAIGTNVQAYDADLTTWAGVTPSANGQSLVSAADYAAMRTALDVPTTGHTHSTYAPLAAIRHVFWPAGAAIPRTTNGAAAATVELATNDVMLDLYDFDSATDEAVQYVGYLEHWGAGTIKVKPSWTAASGSGTVCWSISARALADDDAMDQAFGTAQSSTDTLITANDCHVGPATAAITVAGTPANGQRLQVQVLRDISEDDLNADARLIGIWIEYTEAATQEPAW